MALIIAVLAVVVVVGLSGRLEDAVAPPATFTLATPEPRTIEEQRYLETILPLTERLVGEGRALSQLGESRSRNILELRTRSERFRGAAAAVVAAEQSNGVPKRLTAFSLELNRGIGSALEAIDQAEAAVLRFDWDLVQSSVTTFGVAVETIASAIDTVEST